MNEVQLIKRNNVWIVRTSVKQISKEKTGALLKPSPRNKVFWGTSQGGIRRLIALGEVDISLFVEKILMAIVGPRGRSGFLRKFFRKLFDSTSDIEEVFDSYVEFFEMDSVNSAELGLAQEMFTTYMNVLATDLKLHSKKKICLPPNIRIKTSVADMEVKKYIPSMIEEIGATVEVLLQEAEVFLKNYCPDHRLNEGYLKDLTTIFSNMNNNIGLLISGGGS